MKISVKNMLEIPPYQPYRNLTRREIKLCRDNNNPVPYNSVIARRVSDCDYIGEIYYPIGDVLTSAGITLTGTGIMRKPRVIDVEWYPRCVDCGTSIETGLYCRDCDH